MILTNNQRIFLIVLILYFGILYPPQCSRFTQQYDDFETITKKIDGTQIKTPTSGKWLSDFKYRFLNHEDADNVQMSSVIPKLKKNESIIDAGSHVGDTGLYLALKAKELNREDVIVIMIDPDKSKLEFIKQVAKLNNINNILLLNYGISDVSSEGVIDTNNKHPGGWQIKSTKNNGTFKIEPLGDIIPQKYSNVGLLHLDVEGMEHEALVGAKQLIEKTSFLMIELNGISDRKKTRNLISRFFKPYRKNKNFHNGNEFFVKK